MATFDDQLPQLRFELGGRTDIDDRILGWQKEAYREIGMAYPFEELEESTQDITVPNVDAYDYPPTARAIKALTIVDGDSPYEVKKKNIIVVRRYQVNKPGRPAIWAPYGNQFLLRAVPDKAYTLLIDFWEKPQIDETDSDTLKATEIKLPDDWLEIHLYATLERAHKGLNEFDKAAAVHQTLHGDPNPQKGFPGLYRERTIRNTAENPVSDYGMRPRIRPYGSTR